MKQEFKGFSAEQLTLIESYLKNSRHFSVVVLDQSFVIEYCNQAFCELFGSAKKLNGKPLKNLLQPESYVLLTSEIVAYDMPLQLQLTDQDRLAVSLSCHVVKSDQGYLLLSDHTSLTDNDVLQKLTDVNNEMVLLNRELQREKQALNEAHKQINTLSGIIPICMHCKEIRDDKGYWSNLEIFVAKHSDAKFSHGICPQCMKKRFPEEFDQ